MATNQTKIELAGSAGTGTNSNEYTHGLTTLHDDDLEVWVIDSDTSGYGAGVPVFQEKGATAGDQISNSHVQAGTAVTRRPALANTIRQYGWTKVNDEKVRIGEESGSIKPPSGAKIIIQRFTRDADGKYVTFVSGSTIRHTDLNEAFNQVRYQAQEARNGIMGGGAGQNAGEHIDSKSLVGALPALDATNLTNIPAGNLVGTLGDAVIGSDQIVNGSIVDIDINSSAEIAGSKVTPDFGAQDLSTSGTAETGALTVTGNIAVTGTVDGVDIAESVVTKTGDDTLTNKTINADDNTISNIVVGNLKAGKLDIDLTAVESDDSTLASAKAIKTYADLKIPKTDIDTTDTLGTDDTKVPSQKAVKTYVDAQITAEDLDIAGDTGGDKAVDLDSQKLIIAGGTGIGTVGSGTGDKTVTININETVATLVGSQTLTNKTIDSANNTITNIVNADIKSDAAIELSKLDTGALPVGITIGSGNIPAGTIVTDDLDGDSVTHEKLKDSTDTDSDRAVTTNHIRDGAITAAKLLTTGTGKVDIGSLADVDLSSSPTDTQTLIWDNTAGSWKPGDAGQVSGSADGTLKAIKNNDSQIGNSDITTLDFSSDFTIVENPDKEIQVGIAALVATNKRAFSQNYSIPSDSNASSVGPVTINNTYAVTVPANATWLIH